MSIFKTNKKIFTVSLQKNCHKTCYKDGVIFDKKYVTIQFYIHYNF